MVAQTVQEKWLVELNRIIERNGYLPPEKVASSGLYRLNLDKVTRSMASWFVFLCLYVIVGLMKV